jgi:hypothetical protein
MWKRILMAGIVGGVAMFVWESVAHMALPLGEAGIREIPNEQTLLATMHGTLGTAPGFYYFPGMGLGPQATKEQRQAAMQGYTEKLARTPSGLLVYSPPGASGMTPGKLGAELGGELLEAMLAAILLSLARLRSYFARVGFVTVAGVMAAVTTNLSYWNWYGFPGSYTTAHMTTLVVGYLCAGLAMAAVLRTAAPEGA